MPSSTSRRAGLLVIAGIVVATALIRQTARPAARAPAQPATTAWSWYAAPPMQTPRRSPTATTLQDGTVLVVGGYGDNGLLSTAERYDPATGEWVSAGSPAVGRAGQRAALLPDGGVLVAGGYESELAPGPIQKPGFPSLLEPRNTPVARVELYDPGTNTWSNAPSMSVPRAEHTITTLADGRILVTGGAVAPATFGGPVPMSSATAEIYDPATRAWTPAGAMSTGRATHTATRLADGRVLVTGGVLGDREGYLRSAEIYDPKTNAWTPVADLAVGRSNHAAALLGDGRVLISGGITRFGGPPTIQLDSAELFDPATGAWSAAAPMLRSRSGHTITTLADGKTLVVGGRDRFAGIASEPLDTQGPSPFAEVYDAASDTWAPTDNLGVPRGNHALATLPDGSVLVIGGEDRSGARLAAAEVYTSGPQPLSLTTEPVLAPATAGAQYTAALAVAGGALPYTWQTVDAPAGGALPEGITLDAATGVLTGIPIRPGTHHFRVRVTDSESITRTRGYMLRVLASGGGGSPAWVAAGERATFGETFSLLLPLPDGKALLLGDRNGVAEVFDAEALTWVPTAPIEQMSDGFTATLLRDGRVLVAGQTDGSVCEPAAILYNPATGTWMPAGSPQQGRRGHTATLLPDGRVLVAGGACGSTSLATAEVYDPSTDRWQPAGTMITARQGHLATLLPDGRVLAIGGGNLRKAQSADTFDPAADRWVTAGVLPDMAEPATATLLSDGRVLILSRSQSLAVAAVFDPAGDHWEQAPRPSGIANPSTATLLPDDTVLVVGAGKTRVELYDPITRLWFAPPPGDAAGVGGRAVRLSDGNILFAGFSSRAWLYTSGETPFHITAPPVLPGGVAGEPYVAALTVAGARGAAAWSVTPGNRERGGALPDGLAVDPGTGVLRGTPATSGRFTFVARVTDNAARLREQAFLITIKASPAAPEAGWSPAAPLSTPRLGQTATLLRDGTALVAGGDQGYGTALASAERYDPGTGQRSPADALAEARIAHTATLLLDGRVLVAGGGTGLRALATAELYDPATNTWSTAGTMAEPRAWHTASLLPDGKVLVAGGVQPGIKLPRVLQSVEIYDPSTDTWSSGPPLPSGNEYLVAVTLPSGEVLIINSRAGPAIYNPTTGIWSLVGSADPNQSTRGSAAATLTDGRVLLVGGVGDGRWASIYDPAGRAWTSAGRMTTNRRDNITATALPDGMVLVAGGGAGSPEFRTSSAELYDPVTNTWFPTGAMDIGRERHTATLLPNGRVLIVGGDETSTATQIYDPAGP